MSDLINIDVRRHSIHNNEQFKHSGWQWTCRNTVQNRLIHVGCASKSFLRSRCRPIGEGPIEWNDNNTLGVSHHCNISPYN